MATSAKSTPFSIPTAPKIWSPYHNKPFAMRIIVGILSSIGILVHLGFLAICFAASGLSDSQNGARFSSILPLLLPLLYYAYCLFSSIAKRQPILAMGIFAHLIIVPFCIQAVHQGVGILVLGPLIMAPCWLGMFVERKRSRSA